jgi:large subunit ribosomal protein L11
VEKQRQLRPSVRHWDKQESTFNNSASNSMTVRGSGRWVIPVIITVYDDRSFKFVTNPAASDLLKKAAGVQKGAGNSKKETVRTITPRNYWNLPHSNYPI